MAYGSAWDMKEQGAIGKTGHQWDYFSLLGIWDRKWALGKMVYRGHGICEKYPFDLSTPPPTFPITAAHPRNAQSTNIRFQADTKNEMTRVMRRSKQLDESRMGWMIAMEADG